MPEANVEDAAREDCCQPQIAARGQECCEAEAADAGGCCDRAAAGPCCSAASQDA